MKNALSIFAAFLLMLSACSKEAAQPETPAAAQEQTTTPQATVATQPAEPENSVYELTMQQINDKPLEERRAIMANFTEEERKLITAATFRNMNNKETFMKTKLKDVLKEQRGQ
jgi:PBP1b-binding outer membrane lipoprotein LpoB